MFDCQVLETVCRPDQFKITSSPVVVDWLVRRGVLTADNTPDLSKVVELIHFPLQEFYQ